MVKDLDNRNLSRHSPSLTQPLQQKHLKLFHNLTLSAVKSSFRNLQRSSDAGLLPPQQALCTRSVCSHCCCEAPDSHCSQTIPLCFAVALNFQSPGLSMDLNNGRFQDNGGCGYVLKPAVLMSSERSFDPSISCRYLKPIQLVLKVQIWSNVCSIIPPRWIMDYGLRYSFTPLSVPHNLGLFFLIANLISLFGSREIVPCWMLWSNNDVKLPEHVCLMRLSPFRNLREKGNTGNLMQLGWQSN